MMLDCQTCFDINYAPQFIDLDFSRRVSATNKGINNSIKHDLKTFALDLVDNLKCSLQINNFISALCEGEYEERLMPSTGATVEAVIKQRRH